MSNGPAVAGRSVVVSRLVAQPITPSSQRMMTISRIVPRIPSPNIGRSFLLGCDPPFSQEACRRHQLSGPRPGPAAIEMGPIAHDAARLGSCTAWRAMAGGSPHHGARRSVERGGGGLSCRVLRGIRHVVQLPAPRPISRHAQGRRRGPIREGRMAGPTGFEPAISSVTGWHVGPLHHGPAAVTVAEHSTGSASLQIAARPRSRSRSSDTKRAPAAP
jgi:hypothetical protein